MKNFKIKSFCKINLFLRVLKKLKNNYHSIQTLITFCKLYDLIYIKKIKDKTDKISFFGKFGKKIDKKTNTISKLLYFLRKEKLLLHQSFKIKIQKNIPHGSGLGGGSSNAAALLNFFNSKMKLGLNDKKLNKIASKVGFDVPLILKRKNIFLTGKREKILKLNLKFNLLIVYPNIICSTHKIYKKNKNFSLPKNLTNFSNKNKKKFITYLINEKNVLQESVIKFYPRIRRIINLIKLQRGCYFARITGSGSACIGIFLNKSTAISAQKLIKLKYPKYWSIVSKTI